jgi:hypothetical protein
MGEAGEWVVGGGELLVESRKHNTVPQLLS